jgi:hypothetical protein
MGKLARLNAVARAEEMTIQKATRCTTRILRIRPGSEGGKPEVEELVFTDCEPPGMAPWGDFIVRQPDIERSTFIPKGSIYMIVVDENKVQLA